MGSTPMELEMPTAASSPTSLLLQLAAAVPASYYLLGSLLLSFVFLYNLLEFHVVGDVLRGCRGDSVRLTFNPASDLCQHLVSNCRTLRGRYLVTPWLASPHLQTAFLTFFWNPPAFTYTRQVFPVSGGEAIALDWLPSSDAADYSNSETKKTISKEDTTPIVVVVPGLTSDSACSYVKHLVYKIAKRGWNVVVCNHRGLGEIPIKSDCRYNAGLTEDIRTVVNHLHQEYPRAPLFAVGMSMGANLLVKYLGEDGDGTPIAGAASICSPWDLLICDRFLTRNLLQRFYNKVLTTSLKDYVQLNESVYSKLVDWEDMRKSRSVREFDNNVTCLIMNYETADTYYRQCSSVNVVGNVSVPLLCLSALDDPICSKEVIPWDECWANKNVVLATTAHGGHLAFFKGLAAGSLWWVEAVEEFLTVLHSSPFMHGQKKTRATGLTSQESSASMAPCRSINKADYIFAVGNEKAKPVSNNDEVTDEKQAGHTVVFSEHHEEKESGKETVPEDAKCLGRKHGSESFISNLHNIIFPVQKSRNQLSKQNGKSLWLLAYIAIATTWPLVGPVFLMAFRRKLKIVLPARLLRR